jgi:CRP/FNR family transcriptional regulator, cyclic AMP receptor protein
MLFCFMASRASPRLPNRAVLLLPRVKSTSPAFDLKSFLNSVGVARRIVEFQKSETIYSQGAPTKGVKYIQKGGVRLTVINEAGKEAVVAILEPGDFFGEACLAGQSVCMGTATAIVPTSILFIEKAEMIRVLHTEHEFSDRFIAHMLARNLRVEENLVDQLFNSSEKRLARTLLLLAQCRKKDEPQKVIAKITQEELAKMIGTTRPRINFFMNKFKKLGFIECDHEIRVNPSLLNFVLHD